MPPDVNCKITSGGRAERSKHIGHLLRREQLDSVWLSRSWPVSTVRLWQRGSFPWHKLSLLPNAPLLRYSEWSMIPPKCLGKKITCASPPAVSAHRSSLSFPIIQHQLSSKSWR